MLFTRSRFRSLALVTAIATIVLFAIGGLVRGTGIRPRMLDVAGL